MPDTRSRSAATWELPCQFSALIAASRLPVTHLLKELACLILQPREQRQDERLCRWSEALLEGKVEAFVDAQDDWLTVAPGVSAMQEDESGNGADLDGGSRVLEERKEARGPEREVPPETVRLAEAEAEASALAV